MANKRKRNGIDRQGKRDKLFVYVLLLFVAFSFRVAVARFLPNDTPGDGKIYDQIARNVLDRHVYSHDSEPPFAPSLICLLYTSPSPPRLLSISYAVFCLKKKKKLIR